MATKTQIKLENFLIEKYGRENLEACVSHEGRDEYNDGVKLTCYYTKKPIDEFSEHVGTYNHKARRGVWFDYSDSEGLEVPVNIETGKRGYDQ